MIPVNPQLPPRASKGMSSSRGVDIPMGDGHPGSGAEETADGPGVRLYQQNNLYQQRVNVGLDPQEVFAQAGGFETSVHGQAQRDQARDDARVFGEHVVGQAQQAVLEAQAIAKAAAGAAIEQARAELRAEVQQREQLFQQRESELEAQIRILQHEVTTLRHQDRPTSPVTQVVHNGAELVNVAELVSTIADLRAEVQNLKEMSSPNQTRAPATRGIGTQPSAELIQPGSSMSSPHSRKSEASTHA